MMASIAGGTRVGRVCSVAFGLIARRVGRVTRIAMVGCASGRTRTIERDTKGAKTRFIAPAYGKFESSSLQQRVRKLSVPLGDDTLVGCSGAMPCPMITRISATSPAMTVGTMPSGASSLMNRSKNPGVGVRRKLPGDLKAIFESLLSSPLQRRVIAGLRRDQGFAAPSPRLAHAGLRVVHRRLRYTRPEEAKAPLDELR